MFVCGYFLRSLVAIIHLYVFVFLTPTKREKRIEFLGQKTMLFLNIRLDHWPASIRISFFSFFLTVCFSHSLRRYEALTGCFHFIRLLNKLSIWLVQISTFFFPLSFFIDSQWELAHSSYHFIYLSCVCD